jgi:hypothetical protein
MVNCTKELKLSFSFVDQICNLADPDKIKYLLRFKPEQLHNWIQELREQGDPENKLVDVVEKATLLANFIIHNPVYSNKLIWLIRDLLGHKPQMSSSINLSSNSISFIKNAVQSKEYSNCSFVILTRYINPEFRSEFIDLVIDYANQVGEKMDWAMTGEACETLGFLNIDPEKSMSCLASHLNDGGCDGYPGDSIIKVMHMFKSHDDLIVDELAEYLEELGDSVGDTKFLVKYISYFLNSKRVAKKLLIPVAKALNESSIQDCLQDRTLFDEYCYDRSSIYILQLYGLLQAIINDEF